MTHPYTTVHLVREQDILTIQVNAQTPAEAAQMLGRYIHADVYITADERGVCVAQRAIAQELLGDANEKAQRASQIMAAAASREQDINARETPRPSLVELARSKRESQYRDSVTGEPIELDDEKLAREGKVIKLTGPNSLSSPGANPLVGDVMCNEWLEAEGGPGMAAGPCCLAMGHGGRHVDGAGQSWAD